MYKKQKELFYFYFKRLAVQSLIAELIAVMLSGYLRTNIRTDGLLDIVVMKTALLKKIYYLAGGHVGDASMRLNCLELVQAPIQLLQCLQGPPYTVFIYQMLSESEVIA